MTQKRTGAKGSTAVFYADVKVPEWATAEDREEYVKLLAELAHVKWATPAGIEAWSEEYWRGHRHRPAILR